MAFEPRRPYLCAAAPRALVRGSNAPISSVTVKSPPQFVRRGPAPHTMNSLIIVAVLSGLGVFLLMAFKGLLASR